MIIGESLARPEVEPKTELGKRLRAVRAAIGMEDRDLFAERTGISKSTIANYERGDRTPDASMLERYREVWEVDLNWLVAGEGSMFLTPDHPLPAPIQEFLDRKRERESKRRSRQSTHVSPSKADVISTDFIRLPLYNEVRASAGLGAVPASERADGVIAFERRFLRDQGAVPERCSIIWARGTSMKPTIPDGSILVVDHSQREVEHGCIYVFNVCDRLVVKRARWRMDGRLELVSDNTAEDYPVETFGPETADQLHVIGRVVYFCRVP